MEQQDSSSPLAVAGVMQDLTGLGQLNTGSLPNTAESADFQGTPWDKGICSYSVRQEP